jgi:hypothetical protein
VIAWLWDILIGQFCRHKWNVVDQVNLYDGEHATMPYGRKYMMQCSKCGNIKSKQT